MVELWDAYNKDLHKIEGVKLVRGETIPYGMYHIVCDVVVKHIDGSYLLMQRDLNKHHGGLWELSAGGSALQDEEPLACAKRELIEETGITAIQLDELGIIINDHAQAICIEYLCITDCSKDSIILQAGETIDYKWIDYDSLINIYKDQLASLRTYNLIKNKSIL